MLLDEIRTQMILILAQDMYL